MKTRAARASAARWYSVPENADRRKVRMRCYSRALAALSREHRDEYNTAYQTAHEAGVGNPRAAQVAYAAVRDKHPEEFRFMYETEIAASAGVEQAKRAMGGGE